MCVQEAELTLPHSTRVSVQDVEEMHACITVRMHDSEATQQERRRPAYTAGNRHWSLEGIPTKRGPLTTSVDLTAHTTGVIVEGMPISNEHVAVVPTLRGRFLVRGGSVV